MKAMILAAGEGTRLLPLTLNQPKALVPFHGIPLLEILIRRLYRAGFGEIIINVYHFKDQIIRFISDNNGFGARVVFSEEENLLDTGGGIKRAVPLLGNEPVLFHNVDVITNIDLEKFYRDHIAWKGIASLATKERPSSRPLLIDEGEYLVGWENPDKRIRIVNRYFRKPYRLAAFSGLYVLDPSIFSLFPDEDVFSLTPWLLELTGKHKIRSWSHDENYWFDLGTAGNLKMAEEKILPVKDEPGSFVLR